MMDEDGSRSPVYAPLTNYEVESYLNENAPQDAAAICSDFDDDFNDRDYVPDSYSSDSSESGADLPSKGSSTKSIDVPDFIPVGFLERTITLESNVDVPLSGSSRSKDNSIPSRLLEETTTLDSDLRLPLRASSKSIDVPDFIPVGLLEETTTLESNVDVPLSGSSRSKDVPNSIPVESLENITRRREGKKHYCVFCGNPQAKLKRHLLAVHKEEKDMVPLLNASSFTEKAVLAKLRNAGDHAHNIKALKEKTGTVVVQRRKRKPTNIDQFVPCMKCMGWYSKKDLWRHKCVNETKTVQKKQMVKQGRLLLPQQTDNETYNEILVSLRSDPISIVVKNDATIKLLGLRETTKNGFDKDRHGFIRNKLRELGRLLIELRKEPNCENLRLVDFIKPDKFKDVVRAVRKVASYEPGDSKYGTPSLALKLGHSLVRCCVLLKAQAIETGDTVLREQTEAYHELHTIMWEQEITANAARNLHEQKKNTTKTIPLTEDVSKLSRHLTTETDNIIKEMSSQDGIKKQNWERLSVVTLVRIILFNRRRQGEASKMKLTDFNQGLESDKHNVDVLKELSPFEKQLCKVLSRIEITGKRGRIVPVILTNTMKEALEIIVKHREVVGVSTENPFVFARANNGSLGHIRGCNCIRNLVDEVDLQYPQKITSTGLRKHIATMSQLVNLQDNELDVVAQYLGHDIRTHREHYRLPTSTVQVAKVAKLLLALENGKSVSSNTNIDPDDTIQSEEEDDANVVEDNEDDDLDDSQGGNGETSEQFRSVGTSRATDSSKRDMSKRRTWSTEEKDACQRCFLKSFSVGCLPGKKEITDIQLKEPVLQDRTWIQIKNFVRNMIVKKSLT